MKSYLKLFMPVAVAVILGSLTLSFAQTREEGPRPLRGAGADFGFMPPPDGPRGPGGLDPRTLDQLNLTDAQKQEIQNITEASMKSAQTYLAAAREAQEKLRGLSAPEAFDEAEARRLIAARNAAQTELEITRMKTEAAIFNLLTAEQLKAVEALKAQRPERPGFGPRGDKRPPAPPQD